MHGYWRSVSCAIALAVACGFLCGPVSSAAARTAGRKAAPPKPFQGAVVSVTNNSITISVKPKNSNDSDQLTFACSAQTTKVGLKTADGIQRVSGTAISIGDQVSIRASARGALANPTVYADVIVIESQGTTKASSKTAKKP